MSSRKKANSNPFGGLLGGGRGKKGNLEDLIHQFIIQDPNVSSLTPSKEDKRIKTQLKRVKKDNKDKSPEKSTDERPPLIRAMSIEKENEKEKEEDNLPMFPEGFDLGFNKKSTGKGSRKKGPVEIMSPEKKSAISPEKKSRSRARSGNKQQGKDNATKQANTREKSKENSRRKSKGKGKKVKEEEEGEEEDMEAGFMMFDDNNPFDETEHEKKLPYWLQDENVRDAKGRIPSEEDYDPRTIEIPEIEYNKLPSVQKKYWDFKKQYFDKIVAFKMWTCYFFYGNDALIIHRHLDTLLRYYQGRVYSYCFEKVLFEMAPKLLDAGYQIVILKQSHDLMVKGPDAEKPREIFKILTKGTYTESSNLTYSSQFCLCLYEQGDNIGLVYFDTTTHEFYVGEFKDDESRNNLRTILTRIKPAEIVYYKSFISETTLNILKGLPFKPSFSPQYLAKDYLSLLGIGRMLDEIQDMFSPNEQSRPPLPDLLYNIKQTIDIELTRNFSVKEDDNQRDEKNTSYYFTLKALVLCLNFLKNIMLADTVFSMGTFYPYDLIIDKKSTLYLDSQALQNLEILDVEYFNSLKENRSLFGYIDKTATPFGKRMLKRWLVSPLINTGEINERLQAVEDLMNNRDFVDVFQGGVRHLPDLERVITRIYGLAGQKKVTQQKFEEFVKNKLLDFLNVLEHLEKVENLITRLQPEIEKFKSSRLKQLVTFKEVISIEELTKKKKVKKNENNDSEEGLFPRVGAILEELKGMVYLKDGLLVPAPRLVPEIDEILADIDNMKEKFQLILEKQRDYYKNRFIKYAHIKQRYELEIPEEALERVPRSKDSIITSKKKGYIRIHTPEIETNVEALASYEIELQKSLLLFMVDYFRKFYEKNMYWQQIVSCLSELDCLCGLAQLVLTMPYHCKPIILPQEDKPIFELEGVVHPCIASQNPNFVPNDIVVEKDVSTFLITGPNMGGKSTLLRQVCIAVIMAQMGSFVPANHFRFSVVDRIFTRIGASDRIFEGKSTFFVELEETYNIMKEASRNSLVIIDELGRGTSTYDGVAIAYSTLKYINEKIGCVTLFATHYHLLLEEFRLYENVENYYMASEVDNHKEEIEFKYKFVKGEADKSYGIIIAKMAGLPRSVLDIAKEKADFMTVEKRNIGFEKSLTDKFNKTIEQLKLFEGDKGDNIEAILEELEHL